MVGANGHYGKSGSHNSAGTTHAKSYQSQERASFAMRMRSVDKDSVQRIYNGGDDGPLDRLRAAGNSLSRAREGLARTLSAMSGLPKHGSSYTRPKGLTKKQASAAANDFARQRARQVSLTQSARQQTADIKQARGRQRAAMAELRSIRNSRSREQNRGGVQRGLFN